METWLQSSHNSFSVGFRPGGSSEFRKTKNCAEGAFTEILEVLERKEAAT